MLKFFYASRPVISHIFTVSLTNSKDIEKEFVKVWLIDRSIVSQFFCGVCEENYLGILVLSILNSYLQLAKLSCVIPA